MNVKRGGVLLLLSIFLAFFTFTILVICYLYLRDMGRYFEIGRLNSTIAPMYEVYIKKSIPEFVNNDIYFPQEGYNGKFFRLKYHELPFNGNFYCCIEKRRGDLKINGKKWDELGDREKQDIIQKIKPIIKVIDKNGMEVNEEIYQCADFFFNGTSPDITRDTDSEGNVAKVDFGGRYGLKVKVSVLEGRRSNFQSMKDMMDQSGQMKGYIEENLKRYIEENYGEIARQFGEADYDYKDKLKQAKVEAKIISTDKIGTNEYEVYASVNTIWNYRIKGRDVKIERATVIGYIVEKKYLINVSVFADKNAKVKRVEVMGRGVLEIKKMKCMY